MNSIDLERRIGRQPVFLDTNILVYTVDKHDQAKQGQARELLRWLEDEGTPIISSQVLMEFYNATTIKLKIAPLQARQLLEGLMRMTVVVTDAMLIRRAVDTSILAQISFWDAAIVVAAAHAGCALLLSEDLTKGRVINSVKVMNPFTD